MEDPETDDWTEYSRVKTQKAALSIAESRHRWHHWVWVQQEMAALSMTESITPDMGAIFMASAESF